jgi:hypothetical protein
MDRTGEPSPFGLSGLLGDGERSWRTSWTKREHSALLTACGTGHASCCFARHLASSGPAGANYVVVQLIEVVFGRGLPDEPGGARSREAPGIPGTG